MGVRWKSNEAGDQFHAEKVTVGRPRSVNLWVGSVAGAVTKLDRLSIAPDPPKLKDIYVGPFKSKNVKGQINAIDHNVCFLDPADLLPSRTRHATVRAMAEGEFTLRRWFPKEVIGFHKSERSRCTGKLQ